MPERTIEHKISITVEKYYEKFPAIKLVTNSTENSVVGKKNNTREIHKHNYPSNDSYCKQLVIFRCKNPKPCELPYSITGIEYNTAAALWYAALTKSNPPEERVFDYNQEFIDAVIALDFSYYDENIAKDLKDRFSSSKKHNKVELDAEALELDEEDAQ